jgi:DNA-binding beta-propeller fold protein YncE
MKKILWLVAAMAFVFTSCKPEEEEETDSTSDYSSGAYIVNEGAFGNNNASITWVGRTGEVLADPFTEVNGAVIGDVLMDVVFKGDRGYAVLNNSQKVIEFNAKTFAFTRSFDGFTYPRNMIIGSDGYGYLTNGSMAGTVEKIDLTTGTVVGSVAVGNGPESMVEYDGKLFVCNTGGWDFDNKISIINLNTFTLITDIFVGDRPSDIAVDANGHLWVLNAGAIFYDADWNVIDETQASLTQISPSSFGVLGTLSIGVLGDHPVNLEISPNGQTIYIDNHGIWKTPIDGGVFTEVVAESGYGFSVNPYDGQFWVCGEADFVSNSTIKRYNPSGALIKTYTGGIGSRKIVFKN